MEGLERNAWDEDGDGHGLGMIAGRRYGPLCDGLSGGGSVVSVKSSDPSGGWLPCDALTVEMS